MQFYLTAPRAIPTEPCAPTEPCLAGNSVASGFDPGVDPVALNPQPLPPGINADFIASLPASFLDTVALNPQPLPPGVSSMLDEPSPEPQFAGIAMASEFDPGVDPVALNPQPLPPQESDLRDSMSGVLRRRFEVALEPQPLPWNEGRFLFNLMSNIGR